MSEATPDVMDALAGLPPGSPVAELRRQRTDVVRYTQTSDEAIFAPADDGGLTRLERLAAALRVAVRLHDTMLGDHYRERLVALVGGKAPEHAEGDAKRRALIHGHVDRVTSDPDSATKADIDALLAGGLSPHAVVSLSQVIAYVNFQSRVLAGLRMLRGAP
jgi:uncharacterized protein YciW